jgi:hypothetical protein
MSTPKLTKRRLTRLEGSSGALKAQPLKTLTAEARVSDGGKQLTAIRLIDRRSTAAGSKERQVQE